MKTIAFVGASHIPDGYADALRKMGMTRIMEHMDELPALVEAGGPMLKQRGLWQRLVKATVPPQLGSALSSSKRLPARAIVVCVSIERILAPSTAEQIRALAQTLNERLRDLSQILGISLPVYVLFTKLDTMGSFGEFAIRLSEDEVKQQATAAQKKFDESPSKPPPAKNGQPAPTKVPAGPMVKGRL